MGIFDTLANMFGLNLETRLRKAVAILMVLVVVVIAMSAIDPIVERFLSALTEEDVEVPFTIPELMGNVVAVFEGLSPIMSYARDATLFSVFFFLGMITRVLAIGFKGTLGSRLQELSDYFTETMLLFKRDGNE